MGGMDVGEGFGSLSSEHAVGKNGGRKGSGGNQEVVVIHKCQFSFFSVFGIDRFSRSQISSRPSQCQRGC